VKASLRKDIFGGVEKSRMKNSDILVFILRLESTWSSHEQVETFVKRSGGLHP